MTANNELIHLYWDIGRAIAGRQEREGWGAAVIISDKLGLCEIGEKTCLTPGQ